MSAPSVLLIGASGALGKPLLDELLRQRSTFARVAILTSRGRRSKFDGVDVEIVTGPLYDAETYQGL